MPAAAFLRKSCRICENSYAGICFDSLDLWSRLVGLLNLTESLIKGQLDVVSKFRHKTLRCWSCMLQKCVIKLIWRQRLGLLFGVWGPMSPTKNVSGQHLEFATVTKFGVPKSYTKTKVGLLFRVQGPGSRSLLLKTDNFFLVNNWICLALQWPNLVYMKLCEDKDWNCTWWCETKVKVTLTKIEKKTLLEFTLTYLVYMKLLWLFRFLLGSRHQSQGHCY